MTWEERIILCKLLLADIGKMLPDKKKEEREDIFTTIENITDLTDSDAFKENTDEEKELDSWNVLIKTVNTCGNYIDIIDRKLYPRPLRYLTLDEAHKELMEDLARWTEEDENALPCISLTEWLDERGFVIVKDGDERLKTQPQEEESGDMK